MSLHLRIETEKALKRVSTARTQVHFLKAALYKWESELEVAEAEWHDWRHKEVIEALKGMGK